ncbi:hypothetical protein ABI_21980 [Asticcacaulis biprosthecium C19]|uniref:Uncharacterized protein n=2 Tax=Asticcacaulis biprosthecium TaxID=76891 RepID=F4QH03_9CAUL|nr:hypothetical protein ABI_21980 [Asticcacaulis biprosthecium C19]
MGFGIGRMGLAFRGPRPVPSWVAPGAAFHIKPAAGWAWINGREYTSFAALVADPTAASFSRPSECYALTSAGTFTRFDSDVPAITDLGLLVEPEETGLGLRGITQSEGPQSATRATVQTNVSGPFGLTGCRITADGTSGSHSRSNTLATIVSGKTYLIYVIVEDSSGDYFQLVAGSSGFGTGVYANFDLLGNGFAGTKGANTITSGIVELCPRRFLVWLSATATGSASTGVTFAIVPSISSTRLASSLSTSAFTISAVQVSEATRWGSPIDTGETVPDIRVGVSLSVKPPSDTYNISVKFGDGTADQFLSGQVVGGGGWACPATLNGRFVTDIIGVTA